MKPAAVMLSVTDHAVIRYCERVLGMDMEGVRKHIHDLCAGPAALQAVCVRAEGHRFEIVNDRVVTVTKGHMTPSKTGRAFTQNRIR